MGSKQSSLAKKSITDAKKIEERKKPLSSTRGLIENQNVKEIYGETLEEPPVQESRDLSSDFEDDGSFSDSDYDTDEEGKIFLSAID